MAGKRTPPPNAADGRLAVTGNGPTGRVTELCWEADMDMVSMAARAGASALELEAVIDVNESVNGPVDVSWKGS